MNLLTRSIAIAGLSAAFAAPWAPGGAENGSANRAVTLYVSAAFGNDGWSGRLAEPNADGTDGPFASFDRARRAVRSLDKSGLDTVTVLFRDGTSRVRAAARDAVDATVTATAVAFRPGDGRAVLQRVDFDRDGQQGRQFHDGVYRLSTPVEFGPEDSGSERTEIAYRNYPGEFPVFSGGVRVLGWQHVGGNKWQTTLPPSTAYFENLYYNGERRLRPRLAGYLGSSLNQRVSNFA
jgi:hypothetical protein